MSDAHYNTDERKQQIQQSFVKSVHAGYTMKVLHDQGVYRHLRLKLDHTWFDIITAPGVLLYTGDMGDFAFRRIEDMFQFFRPQEDPIAHGFYLNLAYWTEKLVSVDRTDGYVEYSQELFVRELRELVDDTEEDSVSEEQAAQIREILESRLEPETDVEAFRMMSEVFDCSEDYAHMGERASRRYIWCLFAIVWAIHVYDSNKAACSIEATEAT